MQILATHRFLAEARREPAPILDKLAALTQLTQLTQLTHGASPVVGPGVKRVSDQRLLGYTREAEQLKLWCYVNPRELPAPVTPPLATVPRFQLRELGVPVEHIERAQAVTRLRLIDRLEVGEAVKEKLRFLFLQLAGGVDADDVELVRRADSVGHLADFLRGQVTDLLLNLDPEQQRVVDLEGRGTILVKGVAGSGKTAVALHRIRRIALQTSLLETKRVLLLTYNRSLATASRELLAALGGARLHDVEVRTMHGWCTCFVGVQPNQVMSSSERKRRIETAVAEVRDRARKSERDSERDRARQSERDSERDRERQSERDRARQSERKSAPRAALWDGASSFWEDEIHLIKGRVRHGKNEYLEMERRGADRPLPRAMRELVWEVYEAYVGAAKKSRRLDWDDVIRLAHQKMQRRGDSAPRYDHVFLDEAQDLTVLAIAVVAQLARPPGELFVGFDAAQSIYERAFRWKDAGIVVRGARSFAFRKNYRNTIQILDAARPVLAAVNEQHARHGGDQAEVLEPEAAVRAGEPLRHLACDPREEAAAIAAEVKRMVRERHVNPGNIAVLAFPNKVKREVCADLRRRGVVCQEHDAESEIRLSDPSTKVLPMKSAKGLEFPIVFIVASGRHFRPTRRGDAHAVEAWDSEMRRMAYVAMTRAMAELILVYPPGDPPIYLEPPSAPRSKVFYKPPRSEGRIGLAPSKDKPAMPTRFEEIGEIARASLMPDFFAVRIDEENLFGELQLLIGKIKLPSPVPQLEKIKRIAAASTSSSGLIAALKEANLWTTLRDILSQVRAR